VATRLKKAQETASNFVGVHLNSKL
jgi:hypothetical protein